MFAAASSIALGFALVVFLFVGLSIYLAIVWQISARRLSSVPPADAVPKKTFGLPEVFLAAALVSFFVMNIVVSMGRSTVQLNTNDLRANLLFTVFIIFFIAAFLQLRRIDIDAIAGFSKTTL